MKGEYPMIPIKNRTSTRARWKEGGDGGINSRASEVIDSLMLFYPWETIGMKSELLFCLCMVLNSSELCIRIVWYFYILAERKFLLDLNLSSHSRIIVSSVFNLVFKRALLKSLLSFFPLSSIQMVAWKCLMSANISNRFYAKIVHLTTSRSFIQMIAWREPIFQ